MQAQGTHYCKVDHVWSGLIYKACIHTDLILECAYA